ncbi:hypothetical protein IW146_003399 [Coemansia sp. RSA 922]|nr:hypothetical protein LPJ71_008837 [Coemansia sp. S17]KAJ2018291.1 hypothetical protein GGI14_002407 [Coemansia sp. S680]KAJ2051401.1 hypothetical protein H4S04_002002 [Coemansia sp. S16]KAJ2099230.1 hypothetical protein GGI09_002893 [Coemansia sp. S100]KAJ2100221.1 hypothetical protein GGI16_003778 [Coemansia sp. S142-1]KAJ2114032.1 hypothetical protein IW146_003399 [Coemansia sp. RSA 922]KAJ2418381.1 hypothetical protein GGF41_005074 [Coemansia sp. RSA 2531]
MSVGNGHSTRASPPGSGHFVSILRRTTGGVLFSDPVYVAPDQTLPDLPDGLQYIVVHPSEVPAKSHTLNELVSASTKPASGAATRSQLLSSPVLPQEEDYGCFSSFLPTRDSSLSTLDAADYAMVSTRPTDAAAAATAIAISEETKESTRPEVLDDISTDLLRELGLTPADLGLDEQPPQPTAGGIETAEDILSANTALLAELLVMQDDRALSGDYGKISDKEQAVAAKLQANLARVAAAHSPAQLRPPSAEIQRAACLMLAKSSTSYAGTLPPQRRYAFVSNASSSTTFPSTATMAPMQRVPPSKP